MPGDTRSLIFKTIGEGIVTCSRAEKNILDELEEQELARGTITDARAWMLQLAGAIRDCEAWESEQRAAKRRRLEAEIAERRAELAELLGAELPPEPEMVLPASSPVEQVRNGKPALPPPPADPRVPAWDGGATPGSYAPEPGDSRPC